MRARTVHLCRDYPQEGEWCEVPSASEYDKDYEVFITDPEDSSEWSCGCEGYKFRGFCSHQERAWEAFCQWSSEVGPQQQTPEQERDHICPRCGGPTDRTWIRDA